MLKTDREIALNDVLIACQKAADHYRQAIDIADDPKSGDLFSELHEKRRAAADSVKRRIEKLGGLPEEPDADRRTLASVATRVRAAIHEEQLRVLIEKAVRLEEDLEKAIDGANPLEWTEETKALLRRLAQDVRSAKRSLLSFR